MVAAVGRSGRVGPKKPTTEKKAVCASQHPIVTDTMLSVVQRGGNAVDAAVDGCPVQATVQQEMTNHTGMVTFLMWEASCGRIHEQGAFVAPIERAAGGL
jgi:gamma-glutamyltranspeptidase/glutathione hydrolase